MRNSISYPIQHWLFTLFIGTLFTLIYFFFISKSFDSFLGLIITILPFIILSIYMGSMLVLSVTYIISYLIKNMNFNEVKFKLFMIIPAVITWFCIILFYGFSEKKHIEILIWISASIISGIIAKKKTNLEASNDLVDDF